MFFNGNVERVAVISPHPDDETVGAGGTLARLSGAGIGIFVCVVTRPYAPDWPEGTEELAREQASKAFDVLGVKGEKFLGFPTVKLNIIPYKELVDAIRSFIEEIGPQVVLAPHPGDLNLDHDIVSRATAVAARPAGKRGPTLLFYEALSSTEWGRVFRGSSFKPGVYVDISSTLERKKMAARCYASEMKRFPHPRSEEGIETLARFRGMEAGLELAEAFQLALHVE